MIETHILGSGTNEGTTFPSKTPDLPMRVTCEANPIEGVCKLDVSGVHVEWHTLSSA